MSRWYGNRKSEKEEAEEGYLLFLLWMLTLSAYLGEGHAIQQLPFILVSSVAFWRLITKPTTYPVGSLCQALCQVFCMSYLI